MMMSRSLRFLFLVAMLPASASFAQTDKGLPQEIESELTRLKIPTEAVSLVIRPVEGGPPLVNHNPGKARNPASVAKLITSWVALDLLGPTHSWDTNVYALGEVNDGTLQGDLLIQGSGDPWFVIEDLWGLLGEVRRAGIKHIEGDLLIDASLFDVQQQDAGAFDGEPFRRYNVLPNAMMVNFKAIDFVLNPDRESGKVNFETFPALPNLRITSNIRVTDVRCRGSNPIIHMRGGDSPDHVVFSGKLPAGCRDYRLGRTAMTPASYLFGLFTTLWTQWDGTISGSHRETRLEDEINDSRRARPVASWSSEDLADVIRPMNKWSNNVMTRMMLFSIGAESDIRPVTRETGLRVLREHLEDRGLDAGDLRIENGSGLSRVTQTSAAFLADMLALAWRQPTMPEFISSLAISGEDGTLRRRLRDDGVRGRMHLKTGSLDDVSAVAGYVHTTDGKTWVVALLVNHKGVHFGRGKALQQEVLSWLVTADA